MIPFFFFPSKDDFQKLFVAFSLRDDCSTLIQPRALLNAAFPLSISFFAGNDGRLSFFPFFPTSE